MNLGLAGLAYGITVVALVLLAIRTKALIAIYKKGQPDPTRRNDKLQRLKMAAGEILGHSKMHRAAYSLGRCPTATERPPTNAFEILHMHVVRLFHAVGYNTSAQRKPRAHF